MSAIRIPHVKIAIKEKSRSRLLEGIGVNWCDAFGMGGDTGLGLNVPLNTPCIPLLDDQKNWELLLDELTLLKVGCIRFMLPPDGFITKRGTMDFDCAHFQRLERLNEWASANGASIFLDTLYVPRHLQVKGEDAPGGAVGNRAAADPVQFAENFAGPLLDYCVMERGWTQVRYYSPVNQPFYNGVFHQPKGDSHRAYVELLGALRTELIERELAPQRVSLLGPGSPSVQDWPMPEFQKRKLEIDALLDAYDQHESQARFDGMPPNANGPSVPMTELIEKYLTPHVNYARDKNKPFLITEMKHAYYGGVSGDRNGPATHDTFLLDAEFSVRAINAGVQGLMRWSFLNPGDSDGHWQLLNAADGSYHREENTFYGYAALIRYARPHSEVLEISVESSLKPHPHVYACALRKAPQGDLTILAVNDHESEQVDATIGLPAFFKGRKINVIRTDRILKHEKVDEIKRDGKSAQIADKLPPRSLNVYTSLDYDPLE